MIIIQCNIAVFSWRAVWRVGQQSVLYQPIVRHYHKTVVNRNTLAPPSHHPAALTLHTSLSPHKTWATH